MAGNSSDRDNSSSQNNSTDKNNVLDQVDLSSLGEYAPEDEVEKIVLEVALNYYEKAREFNERYLNRINNRYEEAREMLEEYKDLTLEIGYPIDFEVFNNMWSAGHETPEFLEEMRDNYAEMTALALETYIEIKENRIDLKKNYLDMFGTEGFDIDPEEGPLWDQVTREDILDHFYDNYVDRN